MINSLGYWRKGSCGWLQGDVIFDSHYVPPVLEWSSFMMCQWHLPAHLHLLCHLSQLLLQLSVMMTFFAFFPISLVGLMQGTSFLPSRYFLPIMILDSCLAHTLNFLQTFFTTTSVHVLVLELQVYSCSQQMCSSVFWFPLHCCHFFSWENMILQCLQVFFSCSLRFGLLYRIQISCWNIDLNEGWCTGFQDETECFRVGNLTEA